MEIYRERFADASAFKTVIIGNVSIDSLRPLLCRYLAALPATHKGEKADKSRLSLADRIAIMLPPCIAHYPIAMKKNRQMPDRTRLQAEKG